MLPNPDSYKKLDHVSLDVGEYWQVGIEYTHRPPDSNQVTHAWQLCDYPIVAGKPDTSKFLKLQGAAYKDR